MAILVVVNDPEDWTLAVPGVELVDARAYLTEPHFAQAKRTRVFNLCRSYRYQSVGYYVSLLAEARGHRPQPSVACIQDMKSQTLARLYNEELDELIAKALAPIRSNAFELSIYFGSNMAKRYEKLAQALHNLFPAPFLRAHFRREEDGWRMTHVAPAAASAIVASHRTFVAEAAARYFARSPRQSRKESLRYDMAILFNPSDELAPSNAKAIERFIRAAKQLSINAQVIGRTDVGRLAEFDALFIRETTAVNHHTFRFSRRAAAEGLAVLDDPDSILRCTNKVYLAQLLERHKIAAPQTLIVHRDNVHDIIPTLGLPVILKAPDSSFSQGVVKVREAAELPQMVAKLLEASELIVAQRFTPTDFDWRVGLIDGEPLFACKYHMAKNHWQIVNNKAGNGPDYGRVETLLVEDTPQEIIDTAVRAGLMIGRGLYGVDLKQYAGQSVVIEVNDNPNIDAGFEDAALKEQLYARIMASFLRRIEQR